MSATHHTRIQRLLRLEALLPHRPGDPIEDDALIWEYTLR
jgi:hypothetical protein